MSFLYKALLKEQATKGSENPSLDNGHQSNGQQPGFNKSSSGQPSANQPHSSQPQYGGREQFASANLNESAQFHGSSNSIPLVMWIFIGVLLLISGLLGGYIVGGGNSKESNSQLSMSTQEPITDQNQTASNTSIDKPELIKPEAANVASETESASAQLQSQKQSQQQSQQQVQPKPQQQVELQTEPSTPSENTDNQEQQLVINVADINSSSVAVEDVPEDLQAQFALALEESKQQEAAENSDITSRPVENRFDIEVDSTLIDINDLPAIDRALIPELIYEMHIYSSDADERWIRINGVTLYEGDKLTSSLRVAEIRQDIVIWESKYRRFSQVSLEDYR